MLAINVRDQWLGINHYLQSSTTMTTLKSTVINYKNALITHIHINH